MVASFTRMDTLYILAAIALTICVQAVSGGWIDPDTPSDNYSIISYDTSSTFSLIFSDEFNTDNRRFHDGSDPRWTAINKNDYTNYALHYYNHDLVKTNNGYLNISTVVEDVTFDVKDIKNGRIGKHKMTKNYQSGMIQGWNKFCFTGGIVDIRARLPGNGDIGGFWPAIWLLGNLARATYVTSSNNVWPWSYDTCQKDIQAQQLFSACNQVNHFHLNSQQGRGAPEIDIFEVMPGNEKLINTPINKPYLSTSLQIAPAIQNYRPVDAQVPVLEQWYDHGLKYGVNSSLNIFFYGMYLKGIYKERSYLADALSANTNIDSSYFDEFHDYRLEWKSGDDGYIKWYIDGVFRYSIDSSALNITGAKIPKEPMYLILNNAISSTWGFPIPCPQGCPCDCFDVRREECQCAIPPRMMENFPAYFLVDHIRVYQDLSDNSQTIGCSTKEYPTRRYIDAHPHAYTESESDRLKPLKPIYHGGHKCTFMDQDQAINSDNLLTNKGSLECGYGVCDESKRCKCDKGYTGPTCKSPTGYNDVDLDPDTDVLYWSLFFVPSSLLILSTAVLLGFILVVVYRYKYDTRERGSWRMFKPSTYSLQNFVSTFSNVTSIRQQRGYQPIVEMQNFGVDGISSIHYNAREEG